MLAATEVCLLEFTCEHPKTEEQMVTVKHSPVYVLSGWIFTEDFHSCQHSLNLVHSLCYTD